MLPRSQRSVDSTNEKADDFKHVRSTAALAALRNELVERCRRNPKYSLRAFAKNLGIHAATLSHLLRGKRAITPAIAQRLMNKINLPELADGAMLEGGASAAYSMVPAESFTAIREWYHFAILELTKINGFKPSAASAATALGITIHEARGALERLHTLGMIQLRADETWTVVRKRNTNQTNGNHNLEKAFVEYQRQVLTMALRALDLHPLGEREQSSMTFAMNEKLMPDATRMIQAFRRNFCAKLDRKDAKPNRVFHLSVSLYPVSKAILGGKGQKFRSPARKKDSEPNGNSKANKGVSI